jgi:simple sugar transport system permease protein
MRKLFGTHEFIVLCVLAALVLLIGAVNPAFYSLGNVFSLLKGTVILGIFSLGVLVVIVSGNIDISFTAIAAFAMYCTGKLMLRFFPEGPLLSALAVAGAIGILLGSVNALFVAYFRMPALIVSLGTASAIRGFMLAFIGVRIINNLPDAHIAFSRSSLIELTDSTGKIVALPTAFLIYVVVAVLVWLLLRYTMVGRGIYALGGDPVAAERAGFNVRGLQFFIFCFVGFLSGIAGVLHSTYMRNANPFDIVGTELTVIAAVVLGGASITGGKGSVFGTIIGVLFIVIIDNSLILTGVPSYWQRVATGLIIVLSTAATALRARAEARAAAA